MDAKMNEKRAITMYIPNRRDSSKLKGYSTLQNRNSLIGLKPAIAYLPYTQRWQQAKKNHKYENK